MQTVRASDPVSEKTFDRLIAFESEINSLSSQTEKPEVFIKSSNFSATTGYLHRILF